MPSGMIYLRSSWFLYLQSGFGWFFGASDGWLRLPAVLFSLGTIPLAYVFASRLYSKEVAIGIAALLAVSYSEVEMARMTRMYAPFAFMYLLSAMSIYRRYVDRSSDSTVLPLALALITILTHQLGFSLVLLFFIPLLIAPQLSRLDRIRTICSGFVVGAFFLFWDKFFGYFFVRAERLHGTLVAETNFSSIIPIL